ncbi:MAG TPA: carbonic anhydrase [Stellaceae bacterium]|nr:carbonic anhydrase [Stellaceae bacterium]
MRRLISSSLSRRRLVAALALAPVVASGLARRTLAAGAAVPISSEAARQRLVAGNGRYVSGQPLRLDHSRRRETVAHGQMPFAIVLGCSDSRVPPEILFDQGLGDIFTVRVAGNIADDLAIGSMEYAVDHFGTPLIVVLGHERCGAVSATVESVAAGTMPPPHIASLVAALRPAVEASKGMPGDAVENAITTHVRRTVEALRASGPILGDAVARGRLEIVGAEYHLASGRVGFLA